jgi:hypothetical protein
LVAALSPLPHLVVTARRLDKLASAWGNPRAFRLDVHAGLLNGTRGTVSETGRYPSLWEEAMRKIIVPKPPRRLAGHCALSLAGLFGLGLLLMGQVAAQIQQPGVTPPAQQVPGTGDTPPDESLSDRLGKSGGVLQPPAGVDPGIHAPAPEPNPQTTPVIPPPGTPGGDPSVQPK